MKTNKKELLDSFKGGLIVSCQVQHDDPTFSVDFVVKMAKAAQWRGGAAGHICGGFCVWGICSRGTDDSGTCFIGSYSGSVQFFCPVRGLYPDRICAVRGR